MAGGEALRLLLDADMSSHGLVELLGKRGHDVLAAGLDEDLKRLDDWTLFGQAQRDRRVVITHNSHDFPDILREWAEGGQSHHGCVISHLPTNAYGEISRRLDRWSRRFPAQDDWVDLAVSL